MILKKLPYDLSICKLSSIAELNLKKDFYFIGRTEQELSLVCKTDVVPAAAVAREDGWRGLYIDGALDFSVIGILAELSGILAKNRIGIFAVSTYDTDYILVKEENYQRAINALADAGYIIE
ncbi:MAG: ACT domain-containing protein [Clostridia bacterium]|nr:ACT domain-containing protein [Clostridia bacterium]